MRDGTYQCGSAEALVQLGAALGRLLRPGDIVALDGELGVGKTTFAQGLARGVGVREPVTSPSFAIINVHRATAGDFVHMDLYRLDGPDDVQSIGWEEAATDQAICAIEWASRMGELVPRDAIRVELRLLPDDIRLVEIRGLRLTESRTDTTR